MKVSPWILVEDGAGACRVLLGTDPNVIANRVAFIEKTPRVRIRPAHFREDKGTYEDGTPYTDYRWPEFLDWVEGEKGDGPTDRWSRAWCDAMLKCLRYEIT